MPPIPDPNEVDNSFLAFLGVSREEFKEICFEQMMREKGAPRIASLAPDLVAERLTPQGTRSRQRIRLSDRRGITPVALIFGSYTCGPFRNALSRIAEIRERHGKRVEFYFVYIQEAHPDDGWQMEMNRAEGVVFNQPTTDDERAAIAGACVSRLDVSLTVLLDPISNEISEAYAATPSKLYLIDLEGRIAYRTGPGPWDFDIDAWEKAIGAEVESLPVSDRQL